MNWKTIFIIITLAVVHFCAIKASNNQFQCRKYNFMSNFNLNVEDRIVILYNAALCSQYLKKLSLLENLQLKFSDANVTNLQFIMLTAAHSESGIFTELFQKSGNITIFSLRNLKNNIFLPGWMYIFDTCSRLTYELTPQLNGVDIYIKASIFSALYDSICGNCEEYLDEDYDFNGSDNTPFNSTNNDSFENDEALVEATNISKESMQSSRGNNSIPLRILLPFQFVDKCDNCSFNEHQSYIILSSNTSIFDRHMQSTDGLNLWKKTHVNQNNIFQNNFDLSFNASYLTKSNTSLIIKNGLSRDLEINNTVHNYLKYTKNILLREDEMTKSNPEIRNSFHFWLSFHLNKNNTVK